MVLERHIFGDALHAMAREDEEVLLTAEDAEAMPTHQLVFGDRLYLGE